MRRTLAVVLLVGATGVAAALAYAAYENEREFDRLMAVGDHATAGDRSFQAIEAFSGAVALKPDSMIAHMRRGEAYRTQGEAETAVRDFRTASQLDPTATRPLELLGDAQLELGRYDRAVDGFRRSIALDDQNALVLYKLGLSAYRAGLISAAIEPLTRALTLEPVLAEARFLLGLCQRDLRRLGDAKQTFETAVARSPAAVGPREALADVYERLGEPRRAIEQLELLATVDAGRPVRAVAVGLAQARHGQADSAVLTLGRAMERFPEAPSVYAALGSVWLRIADARGDRVALDKAIAALGQAATYSDSTSETLTDLGEAWLLAGNIVEAERAWRQAVARLPAMPQAYRHLARLVARQGRVQEARDALLQYAALVGDREPLGGIATQVADMSATLGDAALAVRWFDRAIDESGPTVALLTRLADAAWKAGDLDRAQAVIADGLAIAPDDAALLTLRRHVAEDRTRRAERLPGN